MQPIICANASGGGTQIHSAVQLDNLAEMGFTHVSGHEFGLNRDTEHWIRNIHKRGMKFVARWPDLAGLGLCVDDTAFENFQGVRNAQGNSAQAGPSHWCEKATVIGEQSAKGYADIGVDGLILQTIMCDRPYPTNWYTGRPEDWRRVTSFWSFDSAAKKDWAKFSGGEWMPSRAISDGTPPDETLMRFYRWYQDAWLQKLDRLSQAAVAAGMSEVWTWYVPFNEWTEENMADATADSMLYVEGWRKKMLAAVVRPVVLTTCIFSILEHWIADAVKSMNSANKFLDWESCGGVRASISYEHALKYTERLGTMQAGIGYRGMYVTDRHIRERRAIEVKPVLDKVVGVMEKFEEGRPRAPERSE